MYLIPKLLPFEDPFIILSDQQKNFILDHFRSEAVSLVKATPALRRFAKDVLLKKYAALTSHYIKKFKNPTLENIVDSVVLAMLLLLEQCYDQAEELCSTMLKDPLPPKLRLETNKILISVLLLSSEDPSSYAANHPASLKELIAAAIYLEYLLSSGKYTTNYTASAEEVLETAREVLQSTNFYSGNIEFYRELLAIKTRTPGSVSNLR